MKFKKLFCIMAVVVIATFNYSCNKQNTMEKQLQDFIGKFEQKITPLSKQTNEASYKASVSGKEADYKEVSRLQYKMSLLYANAELFAELDNIKKSGQVKDSLLLKQMNDLYNEFITEQYDTIKNKEIIDLQSKIENTFGSFRPQVDGKSLSDNEIDNVLKNSTKSTEVKKYWEVSKEIGEQVKDDVIKLAKMRNQKAQELGYANYWEMSLKTNNQDPAEVLDLFDELDEMTKKTFINLKSEIDQYLATKFSIAVNDLKPWHYQNKFFQEGVAIYNVDFDKYYSDKDIVALAEKYYKSIGLDVSDILERSDLYEKEGKYQHAFCMDVDRMGDVRILCNVRPNIYWMNTMLHELGHATYSKYHDRNLPYFLRDAAHIFTTEAIANMFGRFSSNPYWIKDNIGISDEEVKKIENPAFNNLRLQQLVFSRWCQVMFRFEKAFYENPNQDLNTLWWDLVERYQMIQRPENRDKADWASKIHIALYPCYYHNYLLGELLASQLYTHIVTQVLDTPDAISSFTNHPEVGQYLIENVFKPAAKYSWNDMIEKATGEKLTAKYYAEQFIDD